MKNIAIIPARGGSKRIPGKNIKDFLGKPIIAYSIEIALNTGLFDEVMVSTDDNEIAGIAQKYGATVPFMRSMDAANDFASLEDVLLEVITSYKQNNIQIENICCILPTAPLIQKHHILDAYQIISSTEKYESVFPIVMFSYPILRSLKINEQGFVTMNWPQYMDSRSQDLPLAYHDSGSFYWIKTASLLENKSIFTPQSSYIIVDENAVQDIDNDSDWKLAELKYRLLHIC